MFNFTHPGVERTTVGLVAEVASLGLVSVLGIPGNLLLIVVIMVYKRIRTVANGFVLNLG